MRTMYTVYIVGIRGLILNQVLVLLFFVFHSELFQVPSEELGLTPCFCQCCHQGTDVAK